MNFSCEILNFSKNVSLKISAFYLNISPILDFPPITSVFICITDKWYTSINIWYIWRMHFDAWVRHSCIQSPCVSITSCLVLRFNSKSNANCYYCDVMRILTKILEIVVCAPVLKECERKEIWWRTTMEYQSIGGRRY